MVTGGHSASAQAPTDYIQCGGDNPASAIISVPTGTYDIYVKLNIKNAQETASVFTQVLAEDELPTPCKQITTVTVNDKAYTKVASAVSFEPILTILYLASASSESMQSAAAPQVVLVPTATAPCTLAVDCMVDYQGQKMNLSPKKISLTSDSLRVGLLSGIQDQKVKNVIYSVDGKPVYEKNTLQAFDERYVAGGEHTLTRRVIFENGETVTDSKTLERGTSLDIQYNIIAAYLAQTKLIKIIAILIVVLLLLAFVKSVVRFSYKRKLWRQAHIAGVGNYSIDASKTGAQANFYDESIARTLYRYRIPLVGLLVLAAGAMLVSTFIVGSFTVDGVSMLPTLQDKSVHPLVKIQKTLSKINRSEYVPPRGTIVVIHKDENNLFDPQAAVKNYVVKRVVALPGERITVKNGKITVYNNTDHKSGFEPDIEFNWTPLLEGSEFFNIDITLKDSEIFVIGDHRDESIDSRFYGPVDTSHVVGSVIK